MYADGSMAVTSLGDDGPSCIPPTPDFRKPLLLKRKSRKPHFPAIPIENCTESEVEESKGTRIRKQSTAVPLRTNNDVNNKLSNAICESEWTQPSIAIRCQEMGYLEELIKCV